MPSRLVLSGESQNFYHAIREPELWTEVVFNAPVVPKRLLALMEQNAQQIRRLYSRSRRDEEITENHFNVLLAKLVNLEVLNLNHCRNVYDLRFLFSTPKITCLRLSHALYLDPLYFVDAIQSLVNLLEFEMTDVSLTSGFEITSALANKKFLVEVNVVRSGNVTASDATHFLRSVPNIKVFLFTGFFSLDTAVDRIKWYKILRRMYSHVTFT